MITLRRIPTCPLRRKALVAAIGIFDGVHVGHQAILRKAVSRARAMKGTPMAITFYPHPLQVLAPKLLPPLLLSLDQRLRVFESCGVRLTLVIPFNRSFSRWAPQTFVRRLLVERLGVREVVVGHDFGFGAGRSGTVEMLASLGMTHGFKVHAVAPVRKGAERIASRQIREMIRKGELSKAARFLGRPVGLVGRVVHGTGRGRRIGFPTANLHLEAGVLPPVGVYAVGVWLGGRPVPGMANIGFRPTFPGKAAAASGRRTTNPSWCAAAPLLEVHLLGLRRSLYGRRLELAFLGRLRNETRFPSAQALAAQLRRDARRARVLFALHPKGIMV